MIIWQPGQQINNGRFIIQGKPLGSGGFGTTYKALETSTGKLYAIKTLNQQMQLREDFAEQQVKFINEALTIKGFDHQHILKVHEVIQSGELFGVVMEYIDGVTLFQYVQNKGQLAESEALLYIDQIGQALEYIHAKGSLHRDIKPQNILLRQNKQEAVLIDFGLTRSIATKSMTESRTEGYAPIEQYRRKGNFGSHTDVYALAATLYYLLTSDGLKKEGEISPVPAQNRKYDNEPLPEPKHYNSGVTERVNNAILAAMEIEPENRTPTALKFRKNLGLVSIQKSKQKQQNQQYFNNNQPETQKQKLQLLPNLYRRKMLQILFFMGAGLGFTVIGKSILEFNNNANHKTEQGYTKLIDYLAQEKWKEADEETRRVMLAVAKREKEGWLDTESIDNFPCDELRTIDQLWVKYSDSKFGFSVQKHIYQGLGGTRNYDEKISQAFGDKVGWRKEGKWLDNFDSINTRTAQEKGYFPSYGGLLGWIGGGVWVGRRRHSLMSILIKCNI